MFETLYEYIAQSGFGQFQFGNLIMICVGLLFIYLAIRHKFEPLLLVPIGFGVLIGNIPYDADALSLGVYDGPISETNIDYYYVGDKNITCFYEFGGASQSVKLKKGDLLYSPAKVPGKNPKGKLPVRSKVMDMVNQAYINNKQDKPVTVNAVMVHKKQYLSYNGTTPITGPGVYKQNVGGNAIYVEPPTKDDLAKDPDAKFHRTSDGRYRMVIDPRDQDPWNASVFWFLYSGVGFGFFPPLIFLGVGALTDFGPLLSRPKTILLGAAAQIGIFGALLGAVVLGFNLNEAGSIGIIGGADGPTAIFTCSQLAPHLLGAVALSAYSYMAMVPIIQPPIMRLLCSEEERKIKMEMPTDVPRALRIVFPLAGFLLTAFIANGALPLLGMLFFGNLLKECMVTERLSNTAQTTFIDIVTILLGVTVGAKTTAGNFLTFETVFIFVLGLIAFTIATAGGLLFAKLMNVIARNTGGEIINPLIGAAGVSAVPMAARVVHQQALKDDPQNFLLMHAMGPNVAGVIGSAVAAGVLLSSLGSG